LPKIIQKGTLLRLGASLLARHSFKKVVFDTNDECLKIMIIKKNVGPKFLLVATKLPDFSHLSQNVVKLFSPSVKLGPVL
jgi:hypothetical protein